MASREAETLDSKNMYHDMVKETKDGEHAMDQDAGEMYRMGKTPQFHRIFRLSTMIMFTAMVQVTWESVLLASAPGLINGGLAGLFWSYIWTFFGFMTVVLSLGEMASMAPTSGGQYHWVSEFSPKRYQRFLSYMSGWMSVLSWQAGTAGGCFIFGALLQGIIVSYNTSYVPQRWQGTLFAIAIAFATGTINIFFTSRLPRLQKIMIIPHGVGWIAVVIVLWVLAPHTTAKDVFTNFTSNGGWEPLGLSVMVGQITNVWYLVSSDSAAHLSEEVKHAGKSVPRAMVWTLVLNGVMGILVLIAFLFSIPDINAVLDPETNPSGFAFLYIFQQASPNGTIPLLVIITFNFFAGIIDFTASTSRQLFAFGRDGGVPFGRFVARVRNETVPRNAVLITCTISILLSLINLGSTIAFNAIISLQLLSLMSTYCISLGCLVYQRLTGGRDLPPAQWTLGRLSLPINLIAFIYSVFVLFWVSWPQFKDVTATTFNWSSVMFVGVFLFSLVYYWTYGRRTYAGPVVLVRRDY